MKGPFDGVVLVTDHRFAFKDGRLFSSGRYDSAFLDRYRDGFGNVVVMGRFGGEPVRPCGDAVAIEIPPLGRLALGLQLPKLWSAFARATSRRWVVVRLPSFSATALLPLLLLRSRRLIVEVVGSATAFSHVPHPTMAVRALSRVQVVVQWLLCRSAQAVGYVHEDLLASSPPGRRAEVDFYSSVELDDGWFGPPEVGRSSHRGRHSLVSVVSLAHPYKGVDTLLQAVRIVRGHYDVRLRILGDGERMQAYVTEAARLGLADSVEFTGYVSDRALRTALDQADLYVHPAWSEGLPRAVIEASARGRVCVATDVGATRSMVDPDLLVPPRDEAALARAISRALSLRPAEKLEREARALQRSKDYSAGSQSAKAIQLYRRVIDGGQG